MHLPVGFTVHRGELHGGPSLFRAHERSTRGNAVASQGRTSAKTGYTTSRDAIEITSVPDSESAFSRRDAPYIYTASAQWTDPTQDAENVAWTRRSVEQLEPWHYGGAYVNYVQDEPAGQRCARSTGRTATASSWP